MLEPTKRRRIDTVELRFHGPADRRDEAARLLEDLGFVDTSAGIPLLEAFPELATNSGAVVLRGLRYREGLTQRQLADLTVIPQRHISEMENGKRVIGKDIARRLAAALHVDYRVFL